MAQAALQFVISHPAITLAIPGGKSPEQLRANAAAGGATLAPEELERVRGATPAPVAATPKRGPLQSAKRIARKVLGR